MPRQRTPTKDRRPEEEAEEWAAHATAPMGRACLTCAWSKRNPSGGRWLARVLDLKREGKTGASLVMIREKMIEDFDYPPHSVSALENHYKHGPRE